MGLKIKARPWTDKWGNPLSDSKLKKASQDWTLEDWREFGRCAMGGKTRMKNYFIPDGAYQKILEILDEWKILDIGELRKLYGEISIPNLREKVRALERHGLVKSFTMGGRNKYILPGGYMPDNAEYGTNVEGMFRHDLITVRVLREFLKWRPCLEGKIFSPNEEEEDGDYLRMMGRERLCPDAEITIEKNDKKIRVALEVELSRKDKWRIDGKFGRYSGDSRFGRVFFVTDKEGIFKGYAKYLKERQSEVQEKIVLIFDPKLSIKSFDYENARCFYKGGTCFLSSLF